MSSIFDQYERHSQKIAPTTLGVSFPSYDDDEDPMFEKKKVNFPTNERITHLAVCDNYVVAALSNNVLIRRDPKKGKPEPDVIELNRIVPGVQLTGLFLDPTADHLLISFSTELLYLSRKSNKPRPVVKLRGHEVTAIGWQSGAASETTTRPILFGTARGQIFEAELMPDDGIFQSSLELYCKMLYDLGQNCTIVITGLEYHRIAKTDVYFVLATTEERLYHFVGRIPNSDDRPLLQPLFAKYLHLPESFLNLPGSVKHSKLQLYTPQPGATPTSLCWLTKTGIYSSQIDAKAASDPSRLLSGSRMYDFLSEAPCPISFLMTDFHILVLYENHVAGISSLSGKPVFGDYFNESHGKLVNITQDPITRTIWIYAERAVYKYKVKDEERHVWKFYTDEKDFEKAKLFCKDDPIKLDNVLRLQAEHFFGEKMYEKSAEYYAETQKSLEEVAIKLIKVGDETALKTFLKKRLSRLQDSDKAQKTMLVIWIVDLLLTLLGDLRARGKSNTTLYVKIQSELDDFLSQTYTMDCVRSNKSAIYSLMSSHGDHDNLYKLAKSVKDYHMVISHFIHKGDTKGALEALREQPKPELWYRYLPNLLKDDAKSTLTALRVAGKNTDPAKLLPSLVAAFSTENAEELVKFLEYCTNELNCQEQAVHNFLIRLLAQYRADKLKNYLKLQGEEPSMVNYDTRYAVRVCREFNRTEACVQLYTLLGLWESAVDLALEVSVPLARQTVSQLHNCSRQDMKKLWLKIAQHVVLQENGIKEAMKLVETVDLLKIEDVLPHFPDLTTIDHFKDAICSSLKEYNQHIDDLKEEMEDATKSAQVIRNEINAFRSKHSIIQWTDTCYICDSKLLLSPFYSFPCGHRFHMNCLISDLSPLLPPQDREKLNAVVRKESLPLRAGEKDAVRCELDSILAAQCLYCGDLMIELMDKPFIEDEDYERIRREWE